MVHHRQGLPLGLEAGDHLPRIHPRLDDLQRHPPLDRLLEQKRDAKSVLSAPHPLVLEEVAYPSDSELLARAELTRALRK
jgi:hypothetical protein